MVISFLPPGRTGGGMADVALEHLSRVYPNGVRALSDLNLTVSDGELVVLVGPSGSGKTTTLRLIAGLDEPTGGTVRIAGRPVNALPPRDRDVAMVFQRPALYPHLTVGQNLAFGLRLRHRVSLVRRLAQPNVAAENRQTITGRVQETARLLGLEDVLDRLPGQLSGGQQQRTALGRALVRRPAVWLLDEPLSNLDAPLRAEIRRELHLLHQRLGATMIYVTHDQVEAMTLGERVVVLDRGQAQQVGPPPELYRHPRNRFVAGFIGWPPMNFADGRLTKVGGAINFQGEGWSVPVPSVRAAAAPAGQSVILGIRPEDVSLVPDPTGPTVPMEVALVESLGNEDLVTLQRDGWRVTARSPVCGLRATTGQVVPVSLNMDKSHLFDRDTGLALAGKGPDG
jgi:multiple sugar transport system ATP-binding protein